MKTGIMCSLITVRLTTCVAIFWISCSLLTASLAGATRRLLFRSRGHKGMDQLLTRVPVKEPPDLAYVPNAIATDRHTAVTWGTKVMLVSRMASKSLIVTDRVIMAWPTLTPGIEIFFSWQLEPIASTSVLSSFSLRNFLPIQAQMSLRQSSSLPKHPSTCAWAGSINLKSWESFAKKWYTRPWSRSILPSGMV